MIILMLIYMEICVDILQVILGRSMPMEIIQHKNYKEAKLAFLLYQRLWSARAISFVILVMLPIFEVCRTFGYL
jgi:hypothetical protein